MNPIRVLIVDDHPMVRHGLKSLLSKYGDIEIVGEAGDGAAALEWAERLAPDVILLDIQLPGPNGVELVNHLVENAPQAKTVMLTAFDNDEYLLGALSAGAYAYLLKNSSGETVAETIRLVHGGKRLLSPSLIDPVLRQFETLAKAHIRTESHLTEEEIQAMRLVAKGATNEEIAKEMYWGERTAQRKVEDIIAKLGARNRAQAVAEAIKRGLI
ncbi:MAG: response regulator transcription factor [Chloroflexi bacterium]|nr:response regulator transcription factor [Chloroflexota bacterium]